MSWHQQDQDVLSLVIVVRLLKCSRSSRWTLALLPDMAGAKDQSRIAFRRCSRMSQKLRARAFAGSQTLSFELHCG